ncbi:MAG TPA: NifB/NifX family molybdenum-iron cluster-binding protein [Symbiobacteriaceae bacterium]|nr:NifB/NifX family molybdenum-iron cluster-binding protein [Symbiobacteriaceae bacterium]
MRVAISVADGLVAQMDSCQQILVADLENGQVKGRSYLANPGQGTAGVRVAELEQLGVSRLITSGLDCSTKTEFQNAGIRILEGATGSPEAVLTAYVHGNLRPPEENL